MENETLGPWAICTCKYGQPGGYYAAAKSITIVGGKATREKAKLIAAAPELLAALENLIFDCEAHGLTDNDAHLREAHAAIAKAKG